MEEIERWYDTEYDEWERLVRHRIEYDITRRYFDEYITGERLRVLDIGGGPGRYSIYLAEQGHEVTLLDLSKRHLEVARTKAEERGVTLKDYIHGNAGKLRIFSRARFGSFHIGGHVRVHKRHMQAGHSDIFSPKPTAAYRSYSIPPLLLLDRQFHRH
jgi:ubiquinone/menaquinone biosynthesis C-methylase UbiE